MEKSEAGKETIGEKTGWLLEPPEQWKPFRKENFYSSH